MAGIPKNKILERQNNKCADCPRELTPKITHFDHILPKWDGGTNDPANIQALCSICHAVKTHTENKKRAIRKKLERKESDKTGRPKGPFTDLWSKNGDDVCNNLQRFHFKKEVLDYYLSRENSGEFILERGTMNVIRDNNGKINLKFSGSFDYISNNISVVLIDLVGLPEFHQKHWFKHLVNSGWDISSL